MSGKRIIAIFGVFLFIFSILLGNIFVLSLNATYSQKVREQTSYILPFSNGRGTIYDFNMTPLTNAQQNSYVLALPGEANYSKLFAYVAETEKQRLYSAINNTEPLLVLLEKIDGLDTPYIYKKPQRYQTTPIARHIIGYTNSDGKGVAGIENFFDAELATAYDQTFVRCKTNARGALQLGSEPSVYAKQGTGLDVMLTIDDTLQRITEGVATKYMERGSIVVLETATGRIKACVSMPEFDPNNIEKSIALGDTSLVNRITSEFNVGSVFKPLLASIAIENGYNISEKYECKGYIEIDNHIYHCANFIGHGEVDAKSALEVSCNCYFINLGKYIGGDKIFDYANLVGFGEKTQLGGGFSSKAGNLPNKQTLTNTGQLASISFGQGELLATPIQLAAYFNIFANNGVYISPTLVEALVNPYTHKVEKSFYFPQQVQIISQITAETMQQYLISVVENGLAKKAKPNHGTAGGKTSTAQTGRYFMDENQKKHEIYESWFIGFYPADAPKYTIVVLKDGSKTIADECSNVFSQICNSLYYLGI